MSRRPPKQSDRSPDAQMSLRFQWHPVGLVSLDNDRLRFPEVPDQPGVYRFTIGGRVYIGETNRLRRRFQHYRTPGPTQATNIRLNGLLIDALRGGEMVTAEIVSDAEVSFDDKFKPVRFDLKSARLMVENAALLRAELAGEPVINL